MDINNYYLAEGEKPLDTIKDDGGFCAIFRRMAFIGDSLSSGEFETIDNDGNRHWYDLYEHSWGQYIARATGCKAYNLSKGGMTGKEYWESFADMKSFWANDTAAQAYVIALGVNDIINIKQEVGEVKDYLEDKDTFAAYYGKIIQRYKQISPDAKFFFMTMPKEGENDELREKHAELLYEFTKEFTNSYVIDLYKYGPVYDAKFKENFYLHGHLNPMGYVLTAKMTMSYIDYIIRSNPQDFKKAGFINTGIDFGI